MKKERIYISSDGTITKMSEVDTSHLSYALAKAYRDIYNSKDNEEINDYLQKIDDITNELKERINRWKDEHSK